MVLYGWVIAGFVVGTDEYPAPHIALVVLTVVKNITMEEHRITCNFISRPMMILCDDGIRVMKRKIEVPRDVRNVKSENMTS